MVNTHEHILREWCIQMVIEAKNNVTEHQWITWKRKRENMFNDPLKLLINEKKQYERISDERISDGIKILKKEQMLLDECIDEYTMKDRNEYIWNLNVKELEDIRNECDHYDVTRTNFFGIDY